MQKILIFSSIIANHLFNFKNHFKLLKYIFLMAIAMKLFKKAMKRIHMLPDSNLYFSIKFNFY